MDNDMIPARTFTPQVLNRKNLNYKTKRMDEIEDELNLSKNAERMFIQNHLKNGHAKRSMDSMDMDKRNILKGLKSDQDESPLNSNMASLLGAGERIQEVDSEEERSMMFKKKPGQGHVTTS